MGPANMMTSSAFAVGWIAFLKKFIIIILVARIYVGPGIAVEPLSGVKSVIRAELVDVVGYPCSFLYLTVIKMWALSLQPS